MTEGEKEIRNLLENWSAAELRGDAEFLNRTLTDDFTGIGPLGFILTKEQWLDRYKSGDLVNEEFKFEIAKVRFYGQTSIVIGRQIQNTKYRGQGGLGQFRASLIFVKDNSQWKLANLQLSSINEGPH